MKAHKLATPRKYQHLARITAQVTFPIDMLRYDSCHPCDPQDAITITNILEKGGGGVVYVEAFTSGPEPPWTYGRWNSFMCECEPVTLDEVTR